METFSLQIPWTSPIETEVGAGLSSDGGTSCGALLASVCSPGYTSPPGPQTPRGLESP